MQILAEGEGFEPSNGFPLHDFESCAFDHSATLPVVAFRRDGGGPAAARVQL